MIHTIIIEDSEEHRKTLQKLLAAYDDIELVGQFKNAAEGLEGIKSLSPDLIFLDVEMPPGKNGIQMLAEIPSKERRFDVIFTTAHNQFAVDAIDLSCLAYLTKPIDPEKLMTAISKHREAADKETLLAKYEVLVEHLKDLPSGQRPIALPLSNKADDKDLRFVRMEDIAYFVSPKGEHEVVGAYGRYTTFYFTDGSRQGVTKLLREWETKLNPYGAVRISKFVVINLAYVHTYRRSESSVSLFFNGKETTALSVGDAYRADFEGRFLR